MRRAIVGILLAAIAIAVAGAASAEVLSSGAGGFKIQHETVVPVDRASAWNAAVNEIGQWWSDDHTVSGNAGRLTIDPRPLGCFCEMLGGDDGVVHMLVTSVSTPVMLRLTGGLGPLGLMGVDGNMTWEFSDDDKGTRIRFTYAVGGYSADGVGTLAEPVDYVIGEALSLLKAYVERD